MVVEIVITVVVEIVGNSPNNHLNYCPFRGSFFVLSSVNHCKKKNQTIILILILHTTTMKQLFIPLCVSVLLLSACVKTGVAPVEEKTLDTAAPQQAEIKPTVTAPPVVPSEIIKPTKEETTKESYTAAEVATHKNGLSCWLILDNKVYDVTTFIAKHPGGEAILRGCGKDATQMFAKHPESAKEMKEKFYIGDLKS
jgi:Cytochrome b5-like Heme/Steroid binding domain